MTSFIQQIHSRLPLWADQWLDMLIIGLQVTVIAFAAWLAMRIVRRLARRIASRYGLPPQAVLLPRRAVNIAIAAGAIFWSLERTGVSGTVLWTAFTGFVTVGAVAFFAAWSVLSNLFCALLIFTTRALREGDLVELLDAGDKPGYKGRVIDINLVYTTLLETDSTTTGATLQVPNSLFFQRAMRRWP